MVKLFDSEVHLDASPIWCLVHIPNLMSGNLFEFKKVYIYRRSSVNTNFLGNRGSRRIRTRRVR
jgi:hypothetical protein